MNIQFPDMIEYDISKPGDMALYHAHCDLMPFKGLIETTEISIKSFSKMFSMEAVMATNCGDIISENKAYENQNIYMSRVSPIAYSSIILMMVSMLEESFNTACKCYYVKNSYSVEFNDISGKGLDRAILYLEKVAGIRGIKQFKQWEFLDTIREARNMLIHNGGRINGNISKFEKYKFYVRKEDKQLFFDYDFVTKIYETILAFIDYAFHIEPINK